MMLYNKNCHSVAKDRADKEVRTSDDLMKGKFKAGKSFQTYITDMTQVTCMDGKLYVSAMFDCFDSAVLGLAMDTNMKAARCESMWARLKEELLYHRCDASKMTIETVRALALS